MVLISAGLAHAQTSQQVQDEMLKWWVFLTIAVLFIIFGGVILFMFVLQRQFLKACDKEHQLLIYAKSPAGLPEGTIRAMVSFIIIAISLYLSILLLFQIVGENSEFPEALSSLLGAVVGFYFGSRGSKGGDVDKTLKEQVSTIEKGRDQEAAESVMTKIRKGVAMSKTVLGILPKKQREKYGTVISKLEQGYETVSSLTQGGNVKDALNKGQALFDLFKKENPARGVFSNALKSFSMVLGGSGPAIAVIATVVGCGVKLVGNSYEKWKKRILNVPITPAVLPLKVVDANTGFTLLLQSPIFKKAFEKELEANDRPFMKEAAELLSTEDVEDFWNTYKERFDSREQFDRGLQEFRRAALDREIISETEDDPAIFEKTGGPQAFLKSVDQINTDEEAQAALHELTLVVEELQKQGEPVPAIFEKVIKEEEVS
jgi:large-conductance mechanosensitive channel